MSLALLLLACRLANLEAEGGPPPSATPPPGEGVRTTTPPAASSPLVAPAGASLYELALPIRTQDGSMGHLDLQRGHPTLFSMFYTTCPMACPLLVQDIQALEGSLPAENRARLRVVLVSFDPTRDDTAALRESFRKHGLDARWTLGAVPGDSVRELAAALGVRYRPLPDGNFAHTAVLNLVDSEGVVVARSEGTDGREALLAAIQRLTATRGAINLPR